MSPSAEPVTKNSSIGSMAKHLIADSCAWNLRRRDLCLTSKMQTSPFFPAEITYWCCGARTRLDAPCSWHVKAVRKNKFPTNISGRYAGHKWILKHTCNQCFFLWQKWVPDCNVLTLWRVASSSEHATGAQEHEVTCHLVMALVRLEQAHAFF